MVRYFYIGFNNVKMEGKMAESRKQFLLEMPTPLHRELKLKSVRSGVPMREIIRQALEKELEKRNVTHGKLHRRRNRT